MKINEEIYNELVELNGEGESFKVLSDFYNEETQQVELIQMDNATVKIYSSGIALYQDNTDGYQLFTEESIKHWNLEKEGK